MEKSRIGRPKHAARTERTTLGLFSEVGVAGRAAKYKLRHLFLFFCIVFVLPLSPFCGEARAKSLRDAVAGIAKQLEGGIRAEKPLKVFIIDFEGPNRQLGQDIARQLTTNLSQSPRFRIIDRQRLNSVLKEIGWVGPVEPAIWKRIGKKLGADGVVVGTALDWGGTITLDARIIEIETSIVLSSASASAEVDVVGSGEPPAPPMPRGPAAGGAPKITARDYLLRGAAEDEGYGLYSYVILSKRPDSKEQFNTYVSLFEAYRARIQPVSEYLDLGEPKANLNATYWLLAATDLTEIRDRERNADWSFFITNYDYARAQVILSHVAKLGQEGPFIIGYIAPIGKTNVARRPDREEILVMDLSGIHEDDYSRAFLYYQEKVAEAPNTWKEKFDLARIRLAFRSFLLRYSRDIISLASFISRQR
ncbi:MAG: hypothetical protein ACREIG_05810 [Nitrospiraceae bacterium]